MYRGIDIYLKMLKKNLTKKMGMHIFTFYLLIKLFQEKKNSCAACAKKTNLDAEISLFARLLFISFV
jgi:hypothetical protein